MLPQILISQLRAERHRLDNGLPGLCKPRQHLRFHFKIKSTTDALLRRLRSLLIQPPEHHHPEYQNARASLYCFNHGFTSAQITKLTDEISGWSPGVLQIGTSKVLVQTVTDAINSCSKRRFCQLFWSG
ncbi:Hypothetical_protein [Hexamita inflata]|uniref:Hypothetical_protein n=1 Tax=Hexamita inflata TaxID=28002 RepID=A0ABP1HAT8_9EUKA